MATKSDTKYIFSPANLDDETLLVVDFEGREVVSHLFEYHINLISEDPEISFDDVVHAQAILKTTRNGEDYELHGYVADFQQGRRVDEYYFYKAILVPRIWQLQLSFQHHVYQEKTEEDIITEVLKRNGLGSSDFSFDLKGSYPAREFCVQYKETDLDFIQRLMESCGMFYLFDHSSTDKLIITDHMGGLPDVPGFPSVLYNPVSGMVEDADYAESIHAIVMRQKTVTGKVRIRDWNYRTEAYPDAQSQINGEMPGEFYDYGIHVKDQGQAAAIAKVRNEEFECQRKIIEGDGDVTGFHVGHKFTLEEHFRSSMNQEYFLTHLHASGNQRARWDLMDADEEDIEYQNEFTAIPSSVQYRAPRVTPEPKIPGLMTAHVESTSGDYSHLDDQGRYKVKLPFDLRGKGETQHTKTMRMAQPYTSKKGGYHWHLEKESEIVVGCIDGNPERPVILGAPPKPSKSSPVTSENFTQHWLQTTGGNKFWMEDKKGNERIKMETPFKNSIIQMGYKNLEINGIGMTTEGDVQVHGQSSVVLRAGGGFLPQSDLDAHKNAMTHLFGTVGVISTAIGAGVSGTIKSAVNAVAALSALGSWVAGYKCPGVYIGGVGGISLYTPNSIGGLAANGVSWGSLMGVDILATTGANFLTSLGGINIGAGQGGLVMKSGIGDIDVGIHGRGNVKMYTNSGDIEIKTLTGKISGIAPKLIELKSAKHIEFTAAQDIKTRAGKNQREDISQTLTIVAGKDFKNTAGRNYSLVAGSKIDQKAATGLTLKCGQSSITMKPTMITLKCGQSKVSLNVGGRVQLNGMQIGEKAQIAHNIDSSMVNIKGKALAKIKAAMNMIG